MAIAEVKTDSVTIEETDSPVVAQQQPRDLQRTFQLLLATVWLLDAVLQLQPFMFTRGSSGFSGMLNGLASREPGMGRPHDHLERLDCLPPADPDQRGASPSIQFLIAFGIVWKRSTKCGTRALHRLGARRVVVR